MFWLAGHAGPVFHIRHTPVRNSVKTFFSSMIMAADASCRRKTREPYTARDFKICCGEGGATAKLGSGAITRLPEVAPAVPRSALPMNARRLLAMPLSGGGVNVQCARVNANILGEAGAGASA